MRMKLFLSIVIIFLPNLLVAQQNFIPGFIITMDEDTIHGLIDSRGAMRNAMNCSFRKDKSDQITKYLPVDIKAYGFTDGKYYVSRDIFLRNDTITVFLEYLINGKVDIYYYRDANDDFYFIEKDNVSLTELDNKNKIVKIDGKDYVKTNNSFRGVLKYAFAESPQIQKRADNITLNHNNLIEITKDYHTDVCNDEECIIFERKKNRIRFGLQPIISIDYYSFHGVKGTIEEIFPEETNYMVLPDEFYLKSDLDYSLGLVGFVNLPFINENLSLNLQGKFGRYDLSSYGSVESQNSPIQNYNISTSGNMISGNLYLSYTFPKGKIRPVFLLGLSYNYAVKTNDIEVINHYISGQVVTFQSGSTNAFSLSYIGTIMGAGFEIPLNKKYSFNTVLQYNMMKDMYDLRCYSFDQLSLVLGIKYR